MRVYDVAFYSALFFLFGVFLASLGINLLTILILSAFIAALFLIAKKIFKNRKIHFLCLASLSILIFIGAFYSLVFDAYQKQKIDIPFNQKSTFQAKVENIVEKGELFKFSANLASPFSGKILIKTNPTADFKYGDNIEVEGKIEKPQGNYAAYLEKDGIYGLLDYPGIKIVSSNNKPSLKSALFSFKDKIISIFNYSLPLEQAAFMAGLTLGDQSNFSKDFKNNMSKSGTTHLVALSGYNIGILVISVSFLLKFFFSSRRLVFWLSISVIFLFVIMTGAAASVVRAAIMGAILLVANHANRLYSLRNALVLTGFFMVLVNPKILVFDVGFQLSFLAFLGIVYLVPAIRKFFKMPEENGFLSWRENLLATTSAQLAVIPVLLNNFGQFSFFSIIANVLILSFIPVTMGLGFLLAIIGFISGGIAIIFGWFVQLLLDYEIFIINLFTQLNFSPFTKTSLLFTAIYYIFLIAFIIYIKRKEDHRPI